mgnify:FL=1
MRIDKRFFSQIETAFSAVGLPLSVYTATGEQLYPPSEQGVREEEIPHLDFAEGIARMGSMCYLRLDNLKGMVVGAPNYVPNCDQILNMAGILLRAMAGNLDHGMDRDEVLRRVLLDGLNGTELETLAAEHGLEMDRARCAVFFYCEGDARAVEETLHEVFSGSNSDLVVRLDRNSVALLRAMDGSNHDELEELVLAVLDTAREVTGGRITAGIGETELSLTQMAKSLGEARSAMEIGRVYRPGKRVYAFRSLLLERFICEIPPQIAQRYYDALFSKRNARVFNEEMVQTIDKFFECHLNVSEAARQLYIHRNTLVYRLDKVQRATGLDLRAFDDAITFKLLRMLGRVNENPRPA